MDSIIEKIPAYRIAYIRQIGPYGINNVKIMEQLKKWAKFNYLFNIVVLLVFALFWPKFMKKHSPYPLSPFDISVTYNQDKIETVRGDIIGVINQMVDVHMRLVIQLI